MCRRSLLSLGPILLVVAFSPISARGMDQSSLDQYRARLENLRTLVKNCGASASACDPNAVGNDEQVQIPGLGVGANVNSVEVTYAWLRDALRSARNLGNTDRENELRSAASQLDEAFNEVSGERPIRSNIAAARQRANAILGHPEFATVQEDSIWDRLMEHVAMWVDKFFNGIAKFGARSPWIGPVMEWSFIAIALVALALWAMRALQRQRLAVRVEALQQIEPWEEAARNWRDLADEQARAGNWREAVHCLYWASIAVLEGRKFWSPNRSRTPREYVRLLEVGSTRWNLLREQTRGFEHVWYGLHDAARQDYESALVLHEGLRAA